MSYIFSEKLTVVFALYSYVQLAKWIMLRVLACTSVVPSSRQHILDGKQENDTKRLCDNCHEMLNCQKNYNKTYLKFGDGKKCTNNIATREESFEFGLKYFQRFKGKILHREPKINAVCLFGKKAKCKCQGWKLIKKTI